MSFMLPAALAAGASGTSPSVNSTDDDVVRLGKVVVEERTLGRAYFHVEVPGFEILSPFSAKLTKLYAHELQRQRQMLAHFIPGVNDPLYAAPQPIFLDDQPPPSAKTNALYGRTYVLSEGVLTQSLNGVRGVPAIPWGRTPTADRPTIAWARALSADGLVSYTSVYGFDYARQSAGDAIVAADRGLSHIFPLATVYEHRRPRWPEWLEDALDVFGARFYSAQTLQVFMLARLDAPPEDMPVERALAARRPGDLVEELALRRQAAVVFVHWALVGNDGAALSGDDARRAAFWRFVSMASRTPVTAEMFAQHFGEHGWAEVLRMWRSCAERQVRPGMPPTLGTYWPQTQPTFPEVAVRPATRAELVRIKSEYEWRMGREFAAAVPDIAKQCYAQAGWRLHKAYEDGEREPRFLAVLACYEADVGVAERARDFVEEAVAAHVVRPRVYVHQAQFRLADARAKLASGETMLTGEQARFVLEPLRTAQAQRPALAESYHLMVDVWTHCDTPPSSEELGELAQGVRFFPRDLALAYNVGLLHARTSDFETARDIAEQALRFATEGSDVQSRLAKLRDGVVEKLRASSAASAGRQDATRR